MEFEFPFTSISASVPVPWMEKLYGFSSESSLTILTVPVRVPVAEGLKVTLKVVFPLAATVADGVSVRVKSAALVPPMVGVPLNVRVEPPVFSMVKVRTTVPEETSVLPKSVWSAVVGEVSPSVMEVLFPFTSISASVPVPWMEKLYGFSSSSSFTMLTVPVRFPVAEGLKVTLKVVFPLAATVAEGVPVSEKSAPVTVGAPVKVSVPLPVFSMVKIRTTEPDITSVLPKSVWSTVVGEVSPSVMEVLLPFTSISGETTEPPITSQPKTPG